jgi:DNA-binding NtrC family response regulator
MEKILFAEDEEIIRDMCKVMINDKFPDYEVETFPNGNSLAERLEKDVSNVLLVLTDNSMPPGPRGSEIIHKYARDVKFRDIPFILYSGEEELGKRAVKDGAFAFLQKPFDFAPFINLLQKAVDRYKR